ncbi:FAD-binding protein [Geodermatophilus sp. URMC 62]|uniref:FAD-binding protein n=1 Tax=Geodermatophilus sp. URMC 62 TaxID=3423414 RepID=UPI00406C1ED9
MTISLSELEGVLVTDEATLTGCARDYGRVVHRMPSAVLRPAAVRDVVQALRFCCDHGLPVAARGQGHSTAGQAQVAGGLVIDMSTLQGIGPVQDGSVRVQGGATWRQVLSRTVPLGWWPPVVTGYAGLSVGGTLSMGGIGAASFRHGPQVDHVVALQVVTGEGELRTCSPSEHPELFSAVLGGVGQYGVIVEATLALTPVAPRARYHLLGYDDADAFFADLWTLTTRDRVDGLYGQILPGPEGSWSYLLHAVEFFSSTSSDSALLAGLRSAPAARTVMDLDTLAFATVVDEQLEALGLTHLPRVWRDVFLPGSCIETFVADALAELTAEELGPAGFVLVFPIRNAARSHALRLPEEERVALFDICTSGSPEDPDYVPTQLDKARAMYERARALGGTLYPIGSTPLTTEDWRTHYGSSYQALRTAKEHYDPANILTPGAEIS